MATLDDDSLGVYLNKMSDAFPNQKIIVSGYQVSQHAGQIPKNIIKTDDVHQFIDYIDSQSL